MLARHAERICVSFEETRNWLPPAAKVVVTGNPLRREIVELSRRKFDPSAGPRSGSRTLLVLGGSQGSQHLNAAVIAMLNGPPSQFAGWQIVHQTGVEQVKFVRDSYAQSGLSAVAAAFFDDMENRYSKAALAICRAGATTLAELACTGCPAILVPFPHAADNHQMRNAEVFRHAGAAVLVEQGSDAAETALRLADAVQQILRDQGKLATMSRGMRSLSRPDATQKVVAELQSLTRGV
jgi:UDP-N-acetylglucosamine--N-acetylmuramyl-(pentapeptide) pyrophosphoryl-undecaprenol N-acetylglucosamine transferase